MTPALLRRIGCALVLAMAWAAALAAGAQAFTVPELQRLLQSDRRASLPFQELRESPWLSMPMASRGTMHSTSQALEKRVESPRQETWRLLPDRIEWAGPGGAGRKQILFSEAPALAALADVMRRVVAGDLIALEPDFRIELTGDERVWTASLRPRGAEVARHLESVELQGTGQRLQVIIVVERQGERTTTRLLP
jgi:Outer membrane lipoprotein carrier protein LolA-like